MASSDAADLPTTKNNGTSVMSMLPCSNALAASAQASSMSGKSEVTCSGASRCQSLRPSQYRAQPSTKRIGSQ